MNLNKLIKMLKAEILTNKVNAELKIERAFACDLMSDVLALVEEETALLTGLINIQTIRTADMKDINCIIFVRGKIPDKIVINLAEELNITLLSTKYTLFDSCGILYKAGIKGVEIK